MTIAAVVLGGDSDSGKNTSINLQLKAATEEAVTTAAAEAVEDNVTNESPSWQR